MLHDVSWWSTMLHPTMIGTGDEHGGPALFRVEGVTAADPRPAILRHGPLSLAWDVGLGRPDAAWRADGVEVSAWSRRGLYAELAVGPLPPEGLEAVWLGVVRMRARGFVGRRIALPPVTCSFDDENDGVWSGGSDPGQFLDAQTWDGATHRLTIGTDDAERLAERGSAGAVVELLDRGIAVRLPRLPRRGARELHLVAALGPVPAPHADDASTWFAVSLDPRHSGPPWAR